jgi:hypothetical protein
VAARSGVYILSGTCLPHFLHWMAPAICAFGDVTSVQPTNIYGAHLSLLPYTLSKRKLRLHRQPIMARKVQKGWRLSDDTADSPLSEVCNFYRLILNTTSDKVSEKPRSPAHSNLLASKAIEPAKSFDIKMPRAKRTMDRY